MGILSRIRSIIPDYRGIHAGPARMRTLRPRPSTDERVRAELFGGINGRIFFLPYADRNSTGDTPEIRAAMRTMLRDPYVKVAWFTQVLSVLSQDFQIHVHPELKNDDMAQEQAKFVRHCLENVDGEMVGIGQAVLTNLGSDGYSLAEKVWKYETRGKYAGKLVLSKLKPKDPNDGITLIGDQFLNITGVQVNATREVFPISDFTYVRYLHTFDEPHGMAAFRAAYGAHWMRDTVRKLRVIYHQRKASGLLLGRFQDPAQRGPLEDVLKKAATASWMAIPEGVQVEAISLSTASEGDYKSFDDSLREEIITAIAFAHLHILQGGVSDARGNTRIHKAVSDLGPWLLTYLIQSVVNRQIIPDLVDMNFPEVVEYPRITLGGVTNQEILETLQIIEGGQRIGFKPSRSYYANALSIQEADPNDEHDQLQVEQAGGMMGAAMAGMPMAGASPFSERSWQSFAWTADRSRTGNLKAVGTGEHAGQVLYGADAERVLSTQDTVSEDLDPSSRERIADAARSQASQTRDVVESSARPGQIQTLFSEFAQNSGLPSRLTEQLASQLDAAVFSREKTAAAKLASWIGSLGKQLAGYAIKSLVSFAKGILDDALYIPREVGRSVGRLLPGLAMHAAIVAASAAVIAGSIYLPASLPFGYKVLAGLAGAAAAHYGTKGAIARISSPMLAAAVDNQPGWSRPSIHRYMEHFADRLPHDEVALAGPDGQKVASLLASAKRVGIKTFEHVARNAVKRLLLDPDPLSAPVLFNDDELREIADSLAATQAAADLLGRTRIHRLAQKARDAATRFAEFDDIWSDFAELPAIKPSEAVKYFKSLVPALDLIPERYGPRLDRQAFTLAVAADEALLKKVKQVIQDQLNRGKRPDPVGDIERVLEAAGVSHRNPHYAEMVYRTNMMDAYIQGQQAELSHPMMQETFPAWEYLAIEDERARPHHAARNGKLYPSSVPFTEVRGTGPEDVINCRCGFAPIDRWTLQERLSRGDRIERRW